MVNKEPIAAARGFDDILKDLQGVVEQLERGDLPLEESLSRFERGVALARQGQEILDAAERKVEILLQDGTTSPLKTSVGQTSES